MEIFLIRKGVMMKGKLYISVSMVVIVIAILWWPQYKQDKEFMDSLLLHQPTRISEEKVPPSNAQVVVEMEEGATIIINYIDGKIYVSRTGKKV